MGGRGSSRVRTANVVQRNYKHDRRKANACISPIFPYSYAHSTAHSTAHNFSQSVVGRNVADGGGEGEVVEGGGEWGRKGCLFVGDRR